MRPSSQENVEFSGSLAKMFGEMEHAVATMMVASVRLAYVHSRIQVPELDIISGVGQLELPNGELQTAQVQAHRHLFYQHVAHELGFVGQLSSLLRDDGVLLLRVPIAASAYARLVCDGAFECTGGFVNEISLRPLESSLRAGRLRPSPGHDETILVFARRYDAYVWGTAKTTIHAHKPQLPDVIDLATDDHDLVFIQDEAHPVQGISARSLERRRRVVVVHRDSDVLRQLASAHHTTEYPIWVAPELRVTSSPPNR